MKISIQLQLTPAQLQASKQKLDEGVEDSHINL
jgi:hypothetical protein